MRPLRISASGNPRRAAFAFVFITVVLDMLALGVMIPVLPNLILRFRGGDVSAAAEITGVFGFVWAAMQFLCSPALGALSDRFGRRPLILLSNLGLGLDYLLMALAPSLSWLFVGRIISGITAASFPIASAYLSDVTPPERRAAQFGLLSAAFGLGFVIGPAMGGVLGAIDLRLPFWVAAGLSLLNAAYGYFILPESLPADRRAAFRWRSANPLGSLRFLSSHPMLLGLSAASFLYYLAHESLPSVFVLYAGLRYGWRENAVGLALALVGVCSILISALVVGRAVSRLGEEKALYAGSLAGMAGFAIYGLAATGTGFLVGIPVFSFWGLIGPAMQALMTRKVSPQEYGQLQGALGSLRGISGMLGPLLFTQAFARAVAIGGGGPAYSGIPYLLASALLLASLSVSFGVLRSPRAFVVD